MHRTALVTGGNRGIGFEACRALGQAGLTVVLAARDPALGRRAVAELARAGVGGVRFEQLDVGDDDSVRACASRLHGAGVRVDVLVNNAGVYPSAGVLDLDPAAARAAMEQALTVNFWGAFRCCQAFVPGMIKRRYGRVVNVSSGYGSFGEGLEGPAAYCVSKAALNALTVKLARAVPAGADVKVNAVCPGWVRTRMGGLDADLDPAEAVDTIVWLATLPAGGPSGGFFRDREPVPW